MKNSVLVLGMFAAGAGCSERSNDRASSSEPPHVAPIRATAPVIPTTAPRMPPPSADIVLVPGVSIGPFRLGMSRRDIAGLALPTREAATSILVSGPYELHVNSRDELIAVSRRLGSDHDGTPNSEPLIVGGVEIASSTTFDELRRIVPGCAEPEHNEGATVAACTAQTFVLQTLGGVVIQVRTAPADEDPESRGIEAADVAAMNCYEGCLTNGPAGAAATWASKTDAERKAICAPACPAPKK